MVFPNATELAAAGQVITDAFNAFPILTTVLAIILVVKAGPIALRLVRRAFPG